MKYDYPPNYKYSFDKEWEFGMNIKIDDNGKIIRKKSAKNKIKEPEFEFLEKIKGSFLEHIIIGDKIVWDINKDIPEHIRPVKHCIPSDGRYREDLIWLYRSFYYAKNEKDGFHGTGRGFVHHAAAAPGCKAGGAETLSGRF